MSSCCTTIEKPAGNETFTVALAGNPNSGKTTLFNALTGLRQKVANYPGVTVEKKTGKCALPDGRVVDVVDLPGAYSLISRSPDERVAMEVLRGLRKDTRAPDVVVVVVDASNLQRNLYLVSQLIELGRPLVVALNMVDVAERRGIHVDAEALARALGAPVVPVVGHKRTNIGALKETIARAAVAPLPDWNLPRAMQDELLVVAGGLAKLDAQAPRSTPMPESAMTRGGSADAGNELENGETRVAPAWICAEDSGRRIDRYEAIAERLLIGDHAPDVAPVLEREPVRSLLAGALKRLADGGIDPMHADIEAHYTWIERVSSAATRRVEELAAMGTAAPVEELDYKTSRARHWSEKIDRVLVHKVWGLLVFACIMGSLFLALFWAAAPIMDAITSGVGALGELVTARLAEGPVKALLLDGIFAGVGTVIVFVPQIAMLFLFLAILEDSGYLARAAFLMDRLLAKVGLHGKSFIPLLSSFACAIPGIMATRTIENRKERLATILVAPFMACSARLPVYTLLIAVVFASASAWTQAGIMLALYAGGILAAAGTAWVFKRTMMKGPATAFILEMPSYKFPQASQIGRQVWVNTKAFVVKAGTTIFCLSVILWAMSYWPRLPHERAEGLKAAAAAKVEGTQEEKDKAGRNAEAAAQSEYSIAGRMGHGMEPVIKPLGYDWKMGVGLVGAFAAREVFVSTLGITYAAGKSEDDTSDLSSAMQADRYADGKPVWTPLAGVSLMIWFVLAMQCMSTVAIVRRETGGWRWPIFMIVYMNALAYVVCLAVYQTGRILA